MRKKMIVLTAIFGLIAFSGVAAAAEHDNDTEDTGDTTFNFGYDEENGVFIWGSSETDGDYDCTLENGNLVTHYDTDTGDGGLLLEDLTHLDEEGEDSGETVEFQPTEDSEATAPLEYDPEGEDCQLTAGEVAGPQGQVNHGMFLKLFNAMFDGPARGCMVRHIAQSDLGKGDQQVNVPDVDPDAEVGDTGEVDFETVMTDCIHGPDENGEVEGQSNGVGNRPGWVTDMLENKHGNGDEEVESEDSGRRGPPDHAGGKGRP